MKQKNYIAGLYFRLSQEDERQGESVSIDNQRAILRKYAEEHDFEIHGEYIDDGYSGTNSFVVVLPYTHASAWQSERILA